MFEYECVSVTVTICTKRIDLIEIDKIDARYIASVATVS